MSGYYLMPRGWMDMPALDGPNEAYCRRAAWAWLIEKARWADGPANILGHTIHLQRGQMSFSLRFLAEAWGWDVARVRRFISRLSQDGEVCIHSDTGRMIITVCNYEAYTLQNDGSGTPSAQERHRSGTNYNTLNTLIESSTSYAEVRQASHVLRAQAQVAPMALSSRGEDASGQASLLPTADVLAMPTAATRFEEFYKAYPRKVAKAAALKSYRAAMKLIDHEALMEAVKRFEWGEDINFCPYPATWLNQQRWRDEPPKPKAQKQGGKPSTTSAPAPDPSDPLGIQAWCKSIPGVEPTDPADRENGNWTAHGWIVDHVANLVAAEAELPAEWRGNWELLGTWLEAGFEPDAIVQAIETAVGKIRGKGEYAPPMSNLKLFDGWVKAQRRAA